MLLMKKLILVKMEKEMLEETIQHEVNNDIKDNGEEEMQQNHWLSLIEQPPVCFSVPQSRY
jgi:hypothetical protein